MCSLNKIRNYNAVVRSQIPSGDIFASVQSLSDSEKNKFITVQKIIIILVQIMNRRNQQTSFQQLWQQFIGNFWFDFESSDRVFQSQESLCLHSFSQAIFFKDKMFTILDKTKKHCFGWHDRGKSPWNSVRFLTFILYFWTVLCHFHSYNKLYS